MSTLKELLGESSRLNRLKDIHDTRHSGSVLVLHQITRSTRNAKVIYMYKSILSLEELIFKLHGN
jgi:hypothetical protein